MLSKFLHLIASIFAIILILIGIVLTPMPIPFGIILIVLGIALLITTNTAFALWLRNFRKRHPDMDGKIRQAQKWLPGFLRIPLDKTSPDSSDEEAGSAADIEPSRSNTL